MGRHCRLPLLCLLHHRKCYLAYDDIKAGTCMLMLLPCCLQVHVSYCLIRRSSSRFCRSRISCKHPRSRAQTRVFLTAPRLKRHQHLFKPHQLGLRGVTTSASFTVSHLTRYKHHRISCGWVCSLSTACSGCVILKLGCDCVKSLMLPVQVFTGSCFCSMSLFINNCVSAERRCV